MSREIAIFREWIDGSQSEEIRTSARKMIEESENVWEMIRDLAPRERSLLYLTLDGITAHVSGNVLLKFLMFELDAEPLAALHTSLLASIDGEPEFAQRFVSFEGRPHAAHARALLRTLQNDCRAGRLGFGWAGPDTYESEGESRPDA